MTTHGLEGQHVAGRGRPLEYVGMRREGHYIRNVWFKGAWGEELSFALLRDEWLERLTP